MAPEPSHLVNLTKNCLRCSSTDVKFMYFNNSKLSQPRYKCNGCGRLFTYGGTIRAFRIRAAQPPSRVTTSAAVVAADRRTGPVLRGRASRSQRATADSGTREIQETPATTSALKEARTAATSARKEAQTAAIGRARTAAARIVAARAVERPTTGALGLRRISTSEQRESPVESAVESPAVRGPVPSAPAVVGVAGVVSGLVPGDVVDADQRTASGTAATVIAQGGRAKENWTKAVLGVRPYGLEPAGESASAPASAPASNDKRLKVLKIKYDGEESVIEYWA